MIKRLLLPVVAGALVIGSAWGIPAYAHAHESLNDCYGTNAPDGSDGRPDLPQYTGGTRVGRHTLTHLGYASWQLCVHHVSSD